MDRQAPGRSRPVDITEVALIRGADLPRIGWQCSMPFDAAHVRPVTSRPEFPVKPHGGLWTSPLRDDGRTAWGQWCLDEGYGDAVAPIVELVPDPQARVFVVECPADILAAEAAFPIPAGARMLDARIWPHIDWAAMSQAVDALWLTEAGQWATRFSTPGFYGWDCETVFWFRPLVTVKESA